MTRLRRAVNIALTLVGIAVVFLSAILVPDFNLPLRLAGILAGILMIEAGVWNLTSPLLPSERSYNELRREVRSFISRVPELNEVALEHRQRPTEASRERFQALVDDLHASVDRMAEVAGMAEGEEPNRLREAARS